VISDYNKGTVSYELIEHIRREYAGPIFVDTKKTDLARLEGCMVKINAREFAAAKTYATDMIVTHGDQGAKFRDMIWHAPQIQVVDVTGAGDTFLSALVYDYLLNHDLEKAIPFAIHASAVTVQHIGVYAPTLAEIGG
jgi:D-beta-D-heptose 7-phosphate kinase/D-beta-D-heptose 1-phosphate adenosyltransferase